MYEPGLLAGKVVVVTGASRGVGRGIAVALGAQGATVYLTGRTHVGPLDDAAGALEEVATEVTILGGRGIAVRCDHADDAQVEQLFNRVQAEHGRLDILVNNATAIAANPLSRKVCIAICCAMDQRRFRHAGTEWRPMWPIRLPPVTAMLGFIACPWRQAGRSIKGWDLAPPS